MKSGKIKNDLIELIEKYAQENIPVYCSVNVDIEENNYSNFKDIPYFKLLQNIENGMYDINHLVVEDTLSHTKWRYNHEVSGFYSYGDDNCLEGEEYALLDCFADLELLHLRFDVLFEVDLTSFDNMDKDDKIKSDVVKDIIKNLEDKYIEICASLENISAFDENPEQTKKLAIMTVYSDLIKYLGGDIHDTYEEAEQRYVDRQRRNNNIQKLVQDNLDIIIDDNIEDFGVILKLQFKDDILTSLQNIVKNR